MLISRYTLWDTLNVEITGSGYSDITKAGHNNPIWVKLTRLGVATIIPAYNIESSLYATRLHIIVTVYSV
jgi:hypothetical protein